MRTLRFICAERRLASACGVRVRVRVRVGARDRDGVKDRVRIRDSVRVRDRVGAMAREGLGLGLRALEAAVTLSASALLAWFGLGLG